MKQTPRIIAFTGSLAAILLLTMPAAPAQVSQPTVTSLAISPSGPVSPGTVVTLTATVTSGGDAAVHPGQVTFCNAAAAHCIDLAILGQAQLTGTGVAAVRLRLGVGSHSIKAVFAGTPHSATPEAGSASAIQTFDVNDSGLKPTVTTICCTVKPGDTGPFTFSGTFTTIGRSVPYGSLSFLDANHGDLLLDSVPLTFDPFGFVAHPIPGSACYYAVENGVVTADFNNDGIPDLLTADNFACGTGSTGTVLLGNGDGTFTVRASLFNPDVSSAIAVGDFNSDGIPDLATIRVFNPQNGKVTVLLGNGDGNFTLRSDDNFSAYIPPLAVSPPVVADFNGDGIPDLAIFSLNQGAFTVTILLGNGDGTFTVKTPLLDTIDTPSGLVTADFNQDGIADLAWGTYQKLHVLLGKGDGTFTALTLTAPTQSGGNFMLVGDFNGDGTPDLATLSGSSGAIDLGKGDGTFGGDKIFDLVGLQPYLTLGDFDGDGIEDLAASFGYGQISAFFVYRGKGDGTFSHIYPFLDHYPIPAAMVAADFNGDGVTDLALIEDDLNIALGGFTQTVTSSSISLTGGGAHDIVASYPGDTNYASSTSSPVIVTLPGAPTFSPAPGTYEWTQYVGLADSVNGATVYYTLDGSQPTTTSLKYSTPIAVTWQATINAIAVSPSAGNSVVTTATYAIDRLLPPPVFSSPSGTYSHPFTFTLMPKYCNGGTCELYYTINGDGFARYTGPVTITRVGTSMVKAFATEWHYTTSDPSTVTYEIK